MKKFIALSVSQLRIESLAGLTTETVALATPHAADLGSVASAKLQVLSTNADTLVTLIRQERASEYTPEIAGFDKTRDGRFSELKREAKAAEKSSVPEKAAAGKILMAHLRPFWDINTLRLTDQTTQAKAFLDRYVADQAAIAAVATLGLVTVMGDFASANTRLAELYNQRAEEMGTAKLPSASSVKKDVVAAYDDFCTAIEITLSATPGAGLQALFNELNDLRIKYISHLPKSLGEGDHCVIEPIDTQKYAERPVTPIPTVHYREDGKPTVQLSLGKDFDVTYRNNTNVGMAEITIHGKGAYKGSKSTTFMIAR
jgi:hypothetical protein